MCGHVGVVCTSHLGPTGLTFLWKSGKALRWESPSPLKSSRDALSKPGGLSESLPLPSYLPHSSVPEQGPKGGPSSSALGHTLLWQKPLSLAPGSGQVQDGHFTFSLQPSWARAALTPFHIQGTRFTEVGLFA